MSDTNLNSVVSALAAAAALGEIRQVADHPFAVVPDGYVLHSLERQMPAPLRKRGKYEFRDAASFVDYFKTHGAAASLYGQISPPQFIAVFDDHQAGAPGWREHVARYACPFSVEWNTWKELDRKPFKQVDFAQFVENNLPDIIAPAGADMLEISRTLEAKKKVNFASGIRLSNGQQELTYEEEIQGTAGKGRFQIPELFVIAIPVFEGDERYKIEARLRYRIDGSALVLWYELVRPHKILEDAAMRVWKRIEGDTGAVILNGTPDTTTK